METKRKPPMRIVKMRNHVVKKREPSITRKHAFDEFTRAGWIGADQRSPQRFRISPTRHDHASIADSDAATKRGKNLGMLSKMKKCRAVSRDPAQRVVVERRQAVINQRRGSILQDRRHEDAEIGPRSENHICPEVGRQGQGNSITTKLCSLGEGGKNASAVFCLRFGSSIQLSDRSQ